MFGIGLNSRKWVKQSQKTEKETKNNTSDDFNTWKNIIATFNQDLKIFNEKHLNEISELDSTLIYFEMISFPKRLALVQNLTLWGYYHSALQELRFLLETTILAYYLDLQLPKTDYASKIKLMQKHKGELWGVRLRRRAYMKEREFGEEVENVIDEINNSIDQYMQDNKIQSWRLEHLPYIEAEFNECVRHTQKVCAIAMSHFSKCFIDFIYSGDLVSTKIKIESNDGK